MQSVIDNIFEWKTQVDVRYKISAERKKLLNLADKLYSKLKGVIGDKYADEFEKLCETLGGLEAEASEIFLRKVLNSDLNLLLNALNEWDKKARRGHLPAPRIFSFQ